MPRPANRIKSEIIPVRFTPQNLALIDRLADETGEPRSVAIRLAIRAGLQALHVVDGARS